MLLLDRLYLFGWCNIGGTEPVKLVPLAGSLRPWGLDSKVLLRTLTGESLRRGAVVVVGVACAFADVAVFLCGVFALSFALLICGADLGPILRLGLLSYIIEKKLALERHPASSRVNCQLMMPLHVPRVSCDQQIN